MPKSKTRKDGSTNKPRTKTLKLTLEDDGRYHGGGESSDSLLLLSLLRRGFHVPERSPAILWISVYQRRGPNRIPVIVRGNANGWHLAHCPEMEGKVILSTFVTDGLLAPFVGQSVYLGVQYEA